VLRPSISRLIPAAASKSASRIGPRSPGLRMNSEVWHKCRRFQIIDFQEAGLQGRTRSFVLAKHAPPTRLTAPGNSNRAAVHIILTIFSQLVSRYGNVVHELSCRPELLFSSAPFHVTLPADLWRVGISLPLCAGGPIEGHSALQS